MVKVVNSGDWVAWKWMGSFTEGRVVSVNLHRIEIESKGKKIVRNGSEDNPALIIKHVNGSTVAKLLSEVEILKEAKQ